MGSQPNSYERLVEQGLSGQRDVVDGIDVIDRAETRALLDEVLNEMPRGHADALVGSVLLGPRLASEATDSQVSPQKLATKVRQAIRRARAGFLRRGIRNRSDL